MHDAVVCRGQRHLDAVQASQQPRPLRAVLPSHLTREREVEHLPEPRPLMREEVAERYAAAAGREQQQDPEEDDHPALGQVLNKQGRRGGRVLCESLDGSRVVPCAGSTLAGRGDDATTNFGQRNM